jgi:soluble lytic murein transglycosylase-like protein
MRVPLLPAFGALALTLALPAAASAQLYTWRDASGTLVVSATKPEGQPSRTYAVPGARSGAFRTTRPAASSRADAFANLIDDHSARHSISPDLVRAVIQAESAFNPMARSPKGAMGLMQLMPATARQYRVTDAYDAEQNVAAGVAYLKSLLDRYDGNEELALAAYNAGPGAVERYGTVPPYRETRAYVAKIRGTATAPAKPSRQIYKTVEIIDGREVVRYSSAPATTPAGQLVVSVPASGGSSQR